MKKTVLREYAKLIVRCGANVQKGQEVVIFADLDQPEFVQMVVEEAYKAALATATPTDTIFIGGSTFIVADLFTFIKERE